MDSNAGDNIQIIYFKGGHYNYRSGERPPFKDSVYDSIYTQAGEDICHYISFDYMRRVLVDSANMFCAGSITKEQLISNIGWLTRAVQADDKVYELDQRLDISLQIRQKIAEGKNMSPDLNWLLQELNSEISNLRPGLSRWNHSIGREYDPFAWVHCNSDGIVDSTNCGEKMGQQCNEGNCFYFASNADRNKYSCLSKLVGMEPPSIYTAEYDDGGKSKKILYSSNNYNFRFAIVTAVDECQEPVYWA